MSQLGNWFNIHNMVSLIGKAPNLSRPRMDSHVSLLLQSMILMLWFTKFPSHPTCTIFFKMKVSTHPCHRTSTFTLGFSKRALKPLFLFRALWRILQPSYFRRAFTLPRAHQERLFQTHAIYRAINAEPLQQDECQDFLGRLRKRLNIDPSDMVSTFVRLFPDTNTQAAAINSALSDLFLMIFAPSIYFDPVKLQALLPELLPPKRIRLAPFLLWSDLNLVHIARTDVSQIFMGDERTPPHVVTALRYLAQAELPPSLEIGPSRLVCPRL
ncbi:hypothetical protein PsorP6_015690 [Peronosclerospora sorghi]|uniref:Uncharacterized protein n=1 Tax=Peronosclerospora sorghi TaxID=230839 RepID=A0ACC0WPG1_9STRA|nr:hypothetical protein PsorP6_015690 [Peronosclerospora sorghi]